MEETEYKKYFRQLAPPWFYNGSMKALFPSSGNGYIKMPTKDTGLRNQDQHGNVLKVRHL